MIQQLRARLRAWGSLCDAVTLAMPALALLLVLALGISRSAYPWGLGPSEATGWAPAELLAHLHDPYAASRAVTAPYEAAAYGPVYYVVLGIGLRLFGDQFVAFRLISLLCALAVAGGIALIAYRFTRRRWAAALGAGLFLTQWPVQYWVSIQREDLLALALAFGAFALVLHPARPEGAPSRTGAGLAGALAGLGLLTRQTEVLPLLLVLGWTYCVGGSRLALAVVAGALLVAVPTVLVLEIGSHGGLLTTLYTHQAAATTSVSVLRSVLRNLAESPVTWATIVMLLLAGVRVFRGDLDGSGRELGWWLAAYMLIAAGIGLVSSAHVGSNVNYLLEPAAIASLLVAVLAGSAGAVTGSGVWRVALVVVAVGAVVDFARLAHGELLYWRARSYFGHLVSDLRRLTPRTQPVTSVFPELAASAGRRNYFNDPSQYDGRVPEYRHALVTVERSGVLSAIVTLTPSAPAGYRLVRVSAHPPTGIYLPLLYVRAGQ